MLDLICLTLPYRREPFVRALQGIKEAGYQSIGLGLPHADGGYPTEPTVDEAKRIKQIVDDYGLRVGTIYGAKTETDSAEELCRWIDFAQYLDCPILLWVGIWGYRRFPDEPRPAEEFQQQHRFFVEKMRRVSEYAAEREITITLKPHTGNTATGPILRQTLDEIGSPACKAGLDPGNVRYYEGISPEEDVEPVLSDTALLVMKDHRGPRAHADFPVPGEGDVDFVHILKRLRSVDFSGPLVVERVDSADGQNLTAGELDRRIARARDNILAMMRAAGFQP